MKVTKLLLLKKFDEYNVLYFDSKLDSCQFSFTGKNNSAYGTYRRWKAADGKEKSRISIGRCIIWNEENLREILVHEMIHMYVETVEKKHYDGLFGHGWRFRRKCRHILREHSLRVRVHPHFRRIDKSLEPKWWDTALTFLLDW